MTVPTPPTQPTQPAQPTQVAQPTPPAQMAQPAQPAQQPTGTSPWRTLATALRPRASKSQLLSALLCAMLGFAVVVQVRQTQVEGLATLPQSELVRILVQAYQRTEELEREAAALEATREDLLTG